jgi:hypothetical protein
MTRVLNSRKIDRTITVALVEVQPMTADARFKSRMRKCGPVVFKVIATIDALDIPATIAGPYNNVVTAEAVYVQTLRKLRGEPEES